MSNENNQNLETGNASKAGSVLSAFRGNKPLCVAVVAVVLFGAVTGGCKSKSAKRAKDKVAASAALEEDENLEGLSKKEIAARKAKAEQAAADKAAAEANASIKAGFYSIITGQTVEKVASETTPAANPIYDFRYKVCDTRTGLAVEYVGTSEKIVFPKEIEGLPVLEVSVTAQPRDTTDKTIVIPEGVEILRSFKNVSIASIDIPTTAKVIRSGAFYGAKIKGDFVVHSSVLLGTGLFERAEIQKVVWPFGLVPSSTFLNSVGLTNVILSDSVKTVGSGAFAVELNWNGTAPVVKGAGALESVTFPTSLSEMGISAFAGNLKLKNISGLDSCKKFVVVDDSKDGADNTGNASSTGTESYYVPGNQFGGCSSLPLATENRLRSIGYKDSFVWHKERAPQTN